MTFSADSSLLEDFLAFTLNGGRPSVAQGVAPSGVRWTWQGEGVLLLEPATEPTHSVLASAGIHGDETAPIEMLCSLVADIANGRAPLVARMEEGALSLEESLAAYRRGAALVGFCQQQLEKVEQQVRVLDGEPLKPLPAEVQRATQGAGATNDDGDDDL